MEHLAWALRAVFHLDRLLFQVEAQRFLLFHVTAGDPDEKGVIAIGNRMNVTSRKGRSLTGIEAKLLLHGQFGMFRGIAAVQPFPTRHVGVMLVLAIHHSAGAMVVWNGLAALFPTVHQHMHVRFGIVTNRGPLPIRHRMAYVVLQ